MALRVRDWRRAQARAKARKAKRVVKRRELSGGGPLEISRKGLVKKLDSLFSFYIRIKSKRLYGRCPFHPIECFRPIQQCFHFITRSKHSVRWDERNAVGSCAGCNLRMEHDTTFIDTVLSWYKKTHGEPAWEALKADSLKIAKFSREDLKAIVEEIRKKLETIGTKETA